MVSRSGRVPPLLAGAEPGSVVLVCPGARARHRSRPRRARCRPRARPWAPTRSTWLRCPARSRDRGLTHLLCEGGPSLARDLLAAGVVDELCATTVPRLVAGDHLRLAHGDALDVPLELVGLLEEDGTLLARWLVRR